MTALLLIGASVVILILAIVVFILAAVIRDRRADTSRRARIAARQVAPDGLGQWCTCNPHACTYAIGQLDGCSTACAFCAPLTSKDAF